MSESRIAADYTDYADFFAIVGDNTIAVRLNIILFDIHKEAALDPSTSSG